jgi:uncharacterized protein YdeI (YjbR/CyaY-like superfamily)
MQVKSVEAYLQEGCGRCEHYRTAQCKVHLWSEPLRALRKLVLSCGLEETVKWGVPCYTVGGKNVLLVAAFRGHCALQFFRGTELHAEAGVLESPGPNSRSVRYLKFRSLKEVKERGALAKELIRQAVALEEDKVTKAPTIAAEPIPAELARRLKKEPALRKAFDALTPGRRRSHILHISGAKQEETRERRVEKCVPDILAGRGFNER